MSSIELLAPDVSLMMVNPDLFEPQVIPFLFALFSNPTFETVRQSGVLSRRIGVRTRTPHLDFGNPQTSRRGLYAAIPMTLISAAAGHECFLPSLDFIDLNPLRPDGVPAFSFANRRATKRDPTPPLSACCVPIVVSRVLTLYIFPPPVTVYQGASPTPPFLLLWMIPFPPPRRLRFPDRRYYVLHERTSAR